ncbi:MAG: CAP domain-containing protein [Nannocystaceae bacterium]
MGIAKFSWSTRTAALVGALLLGCGDDHDGVGDTTGDTAGSSSSSSTSGGGDGSLAQLCVDTINMYRETVGKPPYARWSEAEACADGQAKSDSMTGTAHGAFAECGEWAQNECPGWPSDPAADSLTGCLAQMWAEGPGMDFNTHGHYINMSSDKYTKVACGFYTTPSGDLWIVHDFQ